jgi:hypothetical protein
MTIRKLKTMGYYGQKTDVPFNFIPDGIRLRLLLHQEDGFKIEHDIDVDNENVTQYIHYNKPQRGCGSFAGIRGSI